MTPRVKRVVHHVPLPDEKVCDHIDVALVEAAAAHSTPERFEEVFPKHPPAELTNRVKVTRSWPVRALVSIFLGSVHHQLVQSGRVEFHNSRLEDLLHGGIGQGCEAMAVR